MRPNSALLVAAALLPSTLASVTAQITVVKPVDPIPPARHAYHAARLASCPPVVYPDSLKRRGIGGRVVLEALVDKLGHVPRSGIVVRESPHAALARAAPRSTWRSAVGSCPPAWDGSPCRRW